MVAPEISSNPPPVEIQKSCETGDLLLHEVTERAATVEGLDSMKKHNQILQKSKNQAQDKLD
jgi:hypothetical protein